MQLNEQKPAMAIAFTIIGSSAAHGQGAIDRLQPLAETSARRLFIAEQVALTKWDSGAAVEGLPRKTMLRNAQLHMGVN
jgi:chorismate mutase